jgi:bifunctional DNA-binding transcriptional regulator/antitoxin component of YhaV-PrlF toxin-antitoxin module
MEVQMPQLVKGGKFVYGISKIGPAGNIVIPPQSIEEYGFSEGDNVILMNGSRRSGGFGMTTVSVLGKSSLKVIGERLPELMAYQIPEFQVVTSYGRLYCWTTIGEGGCITVPPETLSRYGLKIGNRLVIGRGSGLAIGFIAKGPIFEEAMKHPELELL